MQTARTKQLGFQDPQLVSGAGDRKIVGPTITKVTRVNDVMRRYETYSQLRRPKKAPRSPEVTNISITTTVVHAIDNAFAPHSTHDSLFELATDPQFIHLDHIHTDNDTAPFKPQYPNKRREYDHFWLYALSDKTTA